MEEFLVYFMFISFITILNTLSKRVESGEWSGNCEKKVNNFARTLEQALRRASPLDFNRIEDFKTLSLITPLEDLPGKYRNTSEDCVSRYHIGQNKQLVQTYQHVWSSSKYELLISKGREINKASYVCETISPLISIALRELAVKNKIWGYEKFGQCNAKENPRNARQPDYIFIAQYDSEIVYAEIG
ncbi:33753_t:CDS:2 [Gigaspora margarita]|uniref:33753_t:CDS:1 n=1 Tax=Gigaspora margarita TaxID=4874 RepID=A0ABN7V9C7_GIGMA|nr:33753_t:CDS:2 [Gigaspora margarita]